MIVEFFGTPGSGKTTLYNRLKEEVGDETIIFGRDDLSNYFLKKRYLCYIKNFVLHLDFFVKILFLFIKFSYIMPVKGVISFLVYFCQLDIARSLIKEREERIIIFDEGFYQRIQSFVMFSEISTDNSALRKIIEKKFHKYLLVAIFQNTDILSERLKNRSYGIRFLKIRKENKFNVLEKGNSFMDFLLKSYSEELFIFKDEKDLKLLIKKIRCKE